MIIDITAYPLWLPENWWIDSSEMRVSLHTGSIFFIAPAESSPNQRSIAAC
jgi:hypothetical protein